MAKLTVYDRTGNEVGTYEIDPTDLAPRINKQLLHDAVVMYQANLRQGTFARPRAARRWPARPRRCIARRARATPGPARGAAVFVVAADTSSPSSRAIGLSPAAQGPAIGHADGRWRRRLRDDQVTVIDDLTFAAPEDHATWPRILKALKCDGAKTVLVATAGLRRRTFTRSTRNIDGVTRVAGGGA